MAITIQSCPDHWSGARSSKVAVKAIRPSAARTSDTRDADGKRLNRRRPHDRIDGPVKRVDGGFVVPPNRLPRGGRKHPGHEIQRHDNEVGRVVGQAARPARASVIEASSDL